MSTPTRMSSDSQSGPEIRRAVNHGYRLLTPASFHHTEENLICWECPRCFAVIPRMRWAQHEVWCSQVLTVRGVHT